ncbi:hypothetical protein H8E52_08265 [bacterium]|nr:hypothetical protein [bacterium]
MAESRSRRDLEKEVVMSRARRDRVRNERQAEMLGPEREAPPAAPVQAMTLRLSPLAKARLEAMFEKLMKKHIAIVNRCCSWRWSR